jgi:hypothetical protein
VVIDESDGLIESSGPLVAGIDVKAEGAEALLDGPGRQCLQEPSDVTRGLQRDGHLRNTRTHVPVARPLRHEEPIPCRAHQPPAHRRQALAGRQPRCALLVGKRCGQDRGK